MGARFEKSVKKTGAHIPNVRAGSAYRFRFSLLSPRGEETPDAKVDAHPRHLPRIMEQIRGSRQLNDGIEVSWTEGGEQMKAFFSYQEIVDMKINAIDLIENPRFYLMDSRNVRIHATSRGCCET
jgi:hypothetical protein